jgi:hypothetical protein
MSLTVNVVWGGEWQPNQRLTPSLLNGIFQNAQFIIEGSIATASKPAGGIDYTWIGDTFITGLTTATPASGDELAIWDISAGATRKTTVGAVLALGFAGLSPLTVDGATGLFVVNNGTTSGTMAVRTLGAIAGAKLLEDTVATSSAVLARTDTVLAREGSNQVKASVAHVLDAVFVGRAEKTVPDKEADFVLLYDTSTNTIKKTKPSALATALTAWVNFDGRSSAWTSVVGHNLTEDTGADTVTFSSGHGITIGEVRQCWWTGTIPLISSPAMAINTPYWIRSTGASTVSFHLTQSSAENNTGKIDLLSDNGSTNWRLYFWTSNPRQVSGGNPGVGGVVVLNPTSGSGSCGKYRIFWTSNTALAPAVVASGRWTGGDDPIFVTTKATTTTYADVWGQGQDGEPLELNPLCVIAQGSQSFLL